MGGIPLHVRRKVWLRQFLLQGCWNYEGMQNVGFAYSILPALRDRYEGRPEEFSRALKRHLEFFNTHPAMAAVILGAAIRLEERVAGGEADPRAIATLLILYNAAHLAVRYRGFAAGMGGEESAVRFLKEAGFAGETENRKMVAAILGGAYAGVIASHTAFRFGGAWLELGVFLLAALAVHLITVLFRKAVSPSEVLLLLLIVGMLILWQ
jgi:mannose/fructose/N-acetylgalactosamine-specific phosphotransferase system component IID